MTRVAVGIGASELADSWEAGRQAADIAVEELGDATPALVIVYSSTRYEFQSLLAGVREATGDAPLVGASSSGHFFDGRFAPAGEGVAVLVLSRGPYRFGTAAVGGVTGRGEEAGRELADAARKAAGERLGYAAMMLLTDGLQPEQQTLINGIYAVGGVKVPVVGGAAGDDRMMTATKVFHGDQVLGDGAVGVWIESPHQIAVVSAHGWRSRGLPMLVTRAEGPIVYEIGGQPSNEVMDEQFLVTETDDGADEPRPVGFEWVHALGIVEPDGSLLIRGVFFGADGLMRTFAPVPAYAAVQVVSAAADDLLDVAEDVAAGAIENTDAAVVLGFSCVARLDILRERSGEEPRLLQKAAGDARTFGFFTYGEFARTKSVAGVHNATLAAIAL